MAISRRNLSCNTEGVGISVLCSRGSPEFWESWPSYCICKQSPVRVTVQQKYRRLEPSLTNLVILQAQSRVKSSSLKPKLYKINS